MFRPQVVDGNRALRLLLEPIGQRGGGRFIDNAQDFKPGNHARILGGLPLTVVEIGRNGDNGFGDAFAEMASARSLSSFRIMAEICGGE